MSQAGPLVVLPIVERLTPRIVPSRPLFLPLRLVRPSPLLCPSVRLPVPLATVDIPRGTICPRQLSLTARPTPYLSGGQDSLLSLRIPFAPYKGTVRRSVITMAPILTEIDSNLSATMATLWAASTWDARMRCWDQLMEFIEALQDSSGVDFAEHDLERLAMLFIQYRQMTGSSPATLLSTASNISAAMARVCPSLSKVGLLDMTRILRRLQVAPLQALPFTAFEMAQWILSLPRRERLAAALSWVLSARWDDIVRLTRSSITLVPQGWLVHLAETKSSILSDYRPDAFLPLESPPLWMSQALQSLKVDEPLTRMSTDKARQTMQRIQPLPSTLESFPSCRTHFTAHSPRRGSQTCLWRRAAEGSVGFGPLQIAMMGRHKTPNWPVPTSSVRYAADRYAMATAFGLVVTTRYLLNTLSSALAHASP